MPNMDEVVRQALEMVSGLILDYGTVERVDY
jgi:hypothetical protein